MLLMEDTGTEWRGSGTRLALPGGSQQSRVSSLSRKRVRTAWRVMGVLLILTTSTPLFMRAVNFIRLSLLISSLRFSSDPFRALLLVLLSSPRLRLRRCRDWWLPSKSPDEASDKLKTGLLHELALLLLASDLLRRALPLPPSGTLRRDFPLAAITSLALALELFTKEFLRVRSLAEDTTSSMFIFTLHPVVPLNPVFAALLE
mmetsp:Transcript_21420/g.31020  ORF Transcript_21420/g.31020 Transcript_21420/m.31020 type:complete len:203 (-) Transcript_21420:1082-1690(-)